MGVAPGGSGEGFQPSDLSYSLSAGRRAQSAAQQLPVRGMSELLRPVVPLGSGLCLFQRQQPAHCEAALVVAEAASLALFSASRPRQDFKLLGE